MSVNKNVVFNYKNLWGKALCFDFPGWFAGTNKYLQKLMKVGLRSIAFDELSKEGLPLYPYFLHPSCNVKLVNIMSEPWRMVESPQITIHHIIYVHITLYNSTLLKLTIFNSLLPV